MPDTKKTIMEEVEEIVNENNKLRKLLKEYYHCETEEELDEWLENQTLPEDNFERD